MDTLKVVLLVSAVLMVSSFTGSLAVHYVVNKPQACKCGVNCQCPEGSCCKVAK